MKNSKHIKGFTLIELLVVIAIIAILAAILFPVFAQAKQAAKKARYIAQAKQTGTAIVIYTGDYDDLMPLGEMPDLTSALQPAYRPTTSFSPSPADFCNLPGAPTLQAEAAVVWHNATDPYRKNYDLLNPDSIKQTFSSGAFAPCSLAANRVKAPKGSNISYNGLLQGLSQNSVRSVSQCTMLWPGFGNWTYDGFATVSPRLQCNIKGVNCQFNSGGMPQGGAGTRGDTISFAYDGPSWWGFSNGSVHVFTDTSTKFVKYADGNKASGNARLAAQQPWQYLSNTGTVPSSPGAFIRGWFAGSVLYTAAFVPDNPFDGTTGN